MKLYPSFREAVRSGGLDLRGPMDVWLVRGYRYSRDHETVADLGDALVGNAVPLEGSWEGGGEDDEGNPAPEVLRAPPTEWPREDLAASGCVVCCGGLLVGYQEFPEEKQGWGIRLTWPDGVLTLA